MQTKLQTLIETAVSTIIAFWLSVLIGWLVYPLIWAQVHSSAKHGAHWNLYSVELYP